MPIYKFVDSDYLYISFYLFVNADNKSTIKKASKQSQSQDQITGHVFRFQYRQKQTG